MITKRDILIIISVVFVAILLYGIFNFAVWDDFAERAVIYVDGEEYASYNLSEINGTKNVEIKTEFGLNVLEITRKSVRVIDASCPDKLDVKCGVINKPNQTIICVPNRMSVSLVGNNRKVDKVTY